MKFLKKNEEGFSLVELMVVVAIIGILAALAIGRFGTMTQNARRSEAFGNLSQISSLMQVWGQDNAFQYLTSAPSVLAVGFTVPNGVRFTYIATVAASAGVNVAVDGANGYRATATETVANSVCAAPEFNPMIIGLSGNRTVAGPEIWETRSCLAAAAIP